jgi:hypothetical protein
MLATHSDAAEEIAKGHRALREQVSQEAGAPGLARVKRSGAAMRQGQCTTGGEGGGEPAQKRDGEEAVDLGLSEDIERSEAKERLEANHINPEACLGALSPEAEGEVAAGRANSQATDDRITQLTAAAGQSEVRRREAKKGEAASEERRPETVPTTGPAGDVERREASDEPLVGFSDRDEQRGGGGHQFGRDKTAMAGGGLTAGEGERIDDGDGIHSEIS